jgi:hypothetical protein
MPSLSSWDVLRSSPLAVDASPVGGFQAKIFDYNEHTHDLTHASFLEHSTNYNTSDTPVLIRWLINNRKEILMKYNAHPVLYPLRTNTQLYEIDGHIVVSQSKKSAFIYCKGRQRKQVIHFDDGTESVHNCYAVGFQMYRHTFTYSYMNIRQDGRKLITNTTEDICAVCRYDLIDASGNKIAHHNDDGTLFTDGTLAPPCNECRCERVHQVCLDEWFKNKPERKCGNCNKLYVIFKTLTHQPHPFRRIFSASQGLIHNEAILGLLSLKNQNNTPLADMVLRVWKEEERHGRLPELGFLLDVQQIGNTETDLEEQIRVQEMRSLLGNTVKQIKALDFSLMKFYIHEPNYSRQEFIDDLTANEGIDRAFDLLVRENPSYDTLQHLRRENWIKRLQRTPDDRLALLLAPLVVHMTRNARPNNLASSAYDWVEIKKEYVNDENTIIEGEEA